MNEKLSLETLNEQCQKCGPVETSQTDPDGASDGDCNV